MCDSVSLSGKKKHLGIQNLDVLQSEVKMDDLFKS